MITRAEVKYEVWQKLNKSATTKGFYTEEKVNSAVQECLDYIATHMMIADDGWNHKIDYLDTQANQISVDIPPHMAMLLEVRYLVGNIYQPLMYEQNFGNSEWSGPSGVIQYPSRFRMVDNALYFNPALGSGGAKYLQIEYVAYPRRLQTDADFLESQFDRSMFWYTVYRSCSILAGNVGQFEKPWREEEAQWFNAMQQIIVARNRQSTAIKDFTGF